MTPDEHYREAERLLERAVTNAMKAARLFDEGKMRSDKMATAQRNDGLAIAAAQVHATLATLGKRAES